MREKLFTLSRTQREGMWRRFKQTDDRRIAERLHAILLLDSGQNAQSVSTILHIHPKTLKRWIKAFVAGGEQALTTLHYAGCDGLLTDEQQQQFITWLDAALRTTAEAITWIEQQFGFSYTDSGMRKLLKRLDYRYKQPTLFPAKADPEVQAAWVETYSVKGGADASGQGLFPRCRPHAPRSHSESGMDQARSERATEDQLWQESPQHSWGLFAR